MKQYTRFLDGAIQSNISIGDMMYFIGPDMLETLDYCKKNSLNLTILKEVISEVNFLIKESTNIVLEEMFCDDYNCILRDSLEFFVNARRLKTSDVSDMVTSSLHGVMTYINSNNKQTNNLKLNINLV